MAILNCKNNVKFANAIFFSRLLLYRTKNGKSRCKGGTNMEFIGIMTILIIILFLVNGFMYRKRRNYKIREMEEREQPGYRQNSHARGTFK